MHFTALSQSPITITVDDETIQIPRFKRGDWKKFAAEIDAKRLDKVLARFDGDKEKEAAFLSAYTVMPIAPAELRGYVRGDYDGQDYIVRTCLEKIHWSKEKIDTLLEESPEERVEWLAAQLASMVREDRLPPTAAGTQRAPDDKKVVDNPDELGNATEQQTNGGTPQNP